jgi:hypothetical protein
VNVTRSAVKPFAAIVGSGAIAAAAVVAAVLQGSPDAGPVAGDMSTGVTITATNASTQPVPVAVPGIKGPAPLPVEEQGLPG